MIPSQLSVHLLDTPPPEQLAHLHDRLDPAIRLSTGADLPPRVEILVAGRPNRTQLETNGLQTLIIPWAGLPVETGALLAEFPHLQVSNLHHNARPVAEMTLALLLAAARHLIPADRDLRQGDWAIRYARPWQATLLYGKTALILGYGEIGRLVARYCQIFGMRVLATRRRQADPLETDDGVEIYPAGRLAELLPRADALLICLPQTPQTTGLIGEAELALLPERALLVNIGRGEVVAEKPLFQALRTGRLGGAGLDVWYNYPRDEASRAATRPANLPFHELDNVVLSPHRAGHVAETETLRFDALADLLNAAARSDPLPNRVQIEFGY